MALKAAGLVGLGLVWGWWTAPRTEARSRGLAASLVLSAAALQGAEAVWLAGRMSVAPLLTGWVFGFLLHRAFRAALRGRLSRRATS